MPLLYQQNINENSTVAVWLITEPESFFVHQVRLNTIIKNDHKRLQHLAGRYVLHYLDPAIPLNDIIQERQQKPFLENTPHEFSISHCGNYAAAIISMDKKVGLDIETFKPKIIDIQHKFLRETEKNILIQQVSDPVKAITLGWSVKEALFKWLGEQQVDFKKHLQITAIVKHENKFLIDCVIHRENEYSLQATAIFLEEIGLVWVGGEK